MSKTTSQVRGPPSKVADKTEIKQVYLRLAKLDMIGGGPFRRVRIPNPGDWGGGG